MLDIKDSNSIEEAIANFFKPKPVGDLKDVDTLYKCQKCKIRVAAQRQFFIEQAPPVLCLHLSRFTHIDLGNNGGMMVLKDGKVVELSKSLNVTRYVNNATNSKYLLRSMITHKGDTPKSGHYTSIGQTSSDQFQEFNDQRVDPICMPAVMRTASYVVFYEIEPKSWSSLKSNLDKNLLGASNVKAKPSKGESHYKQIPD